MINSNFSKINYIFSNINVIIILIGYPLFTTILIPLIGVAEGSSQTVTIPFRIFSMIVTIITLFLNLKSTIKYPVALKLFFLFWVLLLTRMYYDLEIRTEYYIPNVFKTQIWTNAIIICLIPMISLAKSFKNIDFHFCLKYIYIASNIILLISLFSSLKGVSINERVNGNIALDSISFGQAAVTAIIVSIYRLVNGRNASFILKTLYISSALVGLYIALRSGSRGPLLALMAVFVFWYSFKEKKISFAYFKFILSISIIMFSISYITELFATISPISASRINEAMSGNDMSVKARQDSYSWFLHTISENPVFGNQFARFSNGMYPGYAHNIFLDILLAFGIIGLGIFLFIIIKGLKTVRSNIIAQNNYWPGLIMIQFFTLSMLSGAFYSDPVLNCSIVLTLLTSIKPFVKSY